MDDRGEMHIATPCAACHVFVDGSTGNLLHRSMFAPGGLAQRLGLGGGEAKGHRHAHMIPSGITMSNGECTLDSPETAVPGIYPVAPETPAGHHGGGSTGRIG